MRIIAACALALTLAGCGGQSVGELMTVQPTDCRQPANYNGNSIYAKRLQWQGQKLFVTFEVRNISTVPTTMAGGDNVIKPELVNAQGVRYADDIVNTTGLIGVGMTAGPINPGLTADASTAFDAPRGPYTLEFTTVSPGSVHVMTTGAFRCIVPPL